MTIPINTTAALHLDAESKEQARQNCKQTSQSYNEKVKCNCMSYKSPFKNCPNCGPEYWEEQLTSEDIS